MKMIRVVHGILWTLPLGVLVLGEIDQRLGAVIYYRLKATRDCTECLFDLFDLFVKSYIGQIEFSRVW
jgi:hypothetical protein